MNKKKPSNHIRLRNLRIIASFLVFIIIFLTGILYLVNKDKVHGRVISGSSETLLSRIQLQEKFYSERKVLFIYGTGIPAFTERYQTFAEEFKTRSRWIDVEVKSDREVTERDLRQTTLLLIGTRQSNQVLAKLGKRIPIHVTEDGFRFNRKSYRDAADVFTLFYPNPYNSQYSINIISGNGDAYILNSPQKNFWRMVGDYRIFRNDQCLVFGLFSQDEKTLWEFDPSMHCDFEAERTLVRETPHYRFYLHGMELDSSKFWKIVSRREEAITEIQNFLQLSNSDWPVIDYHIYPGFEDKGLITGDMQLSHLDTGRNIIHTVISEDIRGDDFTRDAILLLRRSLGKPVKEVLELGLSVYFSRDWRGKGWSYWASRLYLSENLAPLNDLLDNELLQKESNLVMEPLAASFVALLIKNWGKELFIKSYPSWAPTPGEIRELQEGWRAGLKQLSAKYKDQIAQDRAKFPIHKGFQKGFCHAHEGYDIYDGYASEMSDQSLAKLKELGTNCISITPFSYLRDPNRPAFFPHSRSAGSETDESIIHAANTAKKLGMSVLLKPHIWMGRSWPGEIEMKSDADWEQFFKYYYRWMRHFAMLAEMYEMEILCTGVELSKTTIGQENHWIEFIGRLRRLYSGKIIYAANWGEEFENITFWDQFDYIGLNCYYPLSSKDDASPEELSAGMKTVLGEVETIYLRYKKPVVFTEIGFTSTPAPWKQPHEPAGRKPVNLKHQADCYQAVFEALHKREWIKGIYWWKWPSYLEYGGILNNDFTPNGKLAENVVRGWYHKSWD